MSVLDASRISRKVSFTQLTRLAEKIEVDGANWTECQLSIQLSLLDGYLLKFEGEQNVLEQSDIAEITHRHKFEDIFSSLKEKLLSLRETHLRSTRAGSVNSASQSQAAGRSKSILPSIQLAKFDGSYTKWHEFMNTFKTLIDNDGQLSSIEKFQMLRSCLTGTASSIIQSLECTEENYLKALDLLEKRYSNNRLIFGSHVNELLNAASIQRGSVQQLRNLADFINGEMRALQSLGTKEQIADAVLINVLSAKLDAGTKAKWEESADLNNLPSWQGFIDFLQNRCRTMEHVQGLQGTQENGHMARKRNHAGRLVVHVSQQGRLCSCCRGNHFIYQCPQYLQLNSKDRYRLIRKDKLCINCLRSGHMMKDCKASSCSKCLQRHHTTLHFNSNGSGGVEGSSQPERGPAKMVGSSCNSSTAKSCLAVSSLSSPNEPLIATVIASVISPTGVKTTCRILLDSASQTHFITEKLAQQLNLKRQHCRIPLSGIGMIGTETRFRARIVIESRHTAFSTAIDAAILKKITSHQPASFINVDKWPIPGNISLADPNFNRPGRIDMLLGAEHFMKLLCVGQIDLGQSLPVVQKTVFGWIISGGGATIEPTSKLRTQQSCLGSKRQLQRDESLLDTLNRFWEIEEVQHHKKALSTEERTCEEHFKRTTTRDVRGRFIVRLPFREDPDTLGCSIAAARRRFQFLEGKFVRNVEFRAAYESFMNEYCDLGHMKPSTDTISELQRYYLPHHGIHQWSGTTKKLRVVFDASCKSSKGNSLNDILLTGPVVQEELFSILCRFRRHKFAATADIVKMYRQILVHHDDARFQSILWRDAQSGKVRTYQLNTVTYGTASASYLATRCINELGVIYKEKFPRAARILQGDVYVDDILTGADTIEDLTSICEDLGSILGNAGMSLHKWSSNLNQIIKRFGSDNGRTLELLDMDRITKTLGMFWHPESDQFTYELRKEKTSSRITKRGALSIIASLFDPLGLINPIIVTAKLFMKELWKIKLDWDESLPLGLHSQWKDFLEHLGEISRLKIDRFISIGPSSVIQMHGFCDASPEAYGACIFIRSRDECNRTVVNLLCAKSRVSPTKVQTLPRLELCAAVLLAELMDKAINSLKISLSDIFCWSDSTVTLAWIAGSAAEWSVFVSHRVATIQQISAVHSIRWRHVPSEQNPADILSRGARPDQLIGNRLWFNGPNYFINEGECWPKMTEVGEVTTEKRNTKPTLLCHVQHDIVASSKFANDYLKLVRVFTHVTRFIRACRKDRRFVNSVMEERQEGEKAMIGALQGIHFRRERKLLLQHNRISTSSHIASLDPFIDEDNLIRVGGRLHNANIEFDAKHPILLPRSHPLTKALVRHLHEKHSHVGCLTLHCIIREKFWIPNGRQLIRAVLHKCIRCFKTKPTTPRQLMGSLPEERVQPNLPFYHAGIDFCGPFSIKQGGRSRASTKAYIALFICFTTKAVHLELVSNLSTGAFIAALKRFIGRRGKCGSISSDNATNFVGARRELNELRKLFLSQEHSEAVINMCQEEGILWKFIPPRSPHFGGLWEASIKKAKNLLSKLMRHELVTFEDFNTIIIQIESILNSRPLTPMSSDPNDLQALTPGHFLIGRPILSIPEPDVTEINITHLSRWQHLSRLHQSFWRRWRKEYLTTLQQRNKWKHPSANLEVGAMVMVKEENTPPSRWGIGRIIKTITGDDGKVRVVDIRTQKGVYRRSVQGVCELPMGEGIKDC